MFLHNFPLCSTLCALHSIETVLHRLSTEQSCVRVDLDAPINSNNGGKIITVHSYFLPPNIRHVFGNM